MDSFKSAITMLPAEEAEGATKPTANENGEVEEISFRAQALVMWGNVLYEQSQVRAAVGKEWKALVDEAVEKFNEAGCQKADIRTALLNHLKTSEIDIPPLPEAEAGKPAEAKAADAETPSADAKAAEAPKAEVKARVAHRPFPGQHCVSPQGVQLPPLPCQLPVSMSLAKDTPSCDNQAEAKQALTNFWISAATPKPMYCNRLSF